MPVVSVSVRFFRQMSTRSWGSGAKTKQPGDPSELKRSRPAPLPSNEANRLRIDLESIAGKVWGRRSARAAVFQQTDAGFIELANSLLISTLI